MVKSVFEISLDKEFQEYIQKEREAHYPNIMILGITGAGKSSLINHIFKTNDADTSNDVPQTRGYCNFYDGHRYGKKVNLIDTQGYELDQSETYLNDVLLALKKTYDGNPVHILWYCLSISNERIEEIDLRVISTLAKQDCFREKLCIVFTQCDQDDDKSSRETSYKDVLRKHDLYMLPTFNTSIDRNVTSQLNDLIQWSALNLKNEDYRMAFIGTQMRNLEVKKAKAEEIIKNTCIIVGASKTEEILSNIDKRKEINEQQAKMVTAILKVYGVDCLVGLTKILDNATAAANLIDKAVGLVGKVVKVLQKHEKVQQAISVATVTLFTKAIGNTTIKISQYYVEKHLKGEPVLLEDFLSNPESAGFIASLFSNGITAVETKMDNPHKSPSKETSQSRRKKKHKKGK